MKSIRGNFAFKKSYQIGNKLKSLKKIWRYFGVIIDFVLRQYFCSEDKKRILQRIRQSYLVGKYLKILFFKIRKREMREQKHFLLNRKEFY